MTSRFLTPASLGAGLLAGLAAGGLMLAMSANANDLSQDLSGARIENFTLTDQRGVGHELYYYKTAPAIVIITHALNDAPSAMTIAAVEKVRGEYEKKGVTFFAINSNSGDSHNAIVKGAASLGLPLLDDELQLVGRALGVTETAEVFVIDPRTWKVAYHGPVDGTLAEVTNPKASMASALDALLANKTPPVTHARVKGTPLTFPDRGKAADFARISYSTEVAPILSKNCVSCHVKGGIGPFAMDSYETVKTYAPMIRESLRTRRMPPYHADRHYGTFSADMNLSPNDILKVVNWIEGGAPRGSGDDPLARSQAEAPEWPLGEPDMILELPAFEVPASGIVDYTDLQVRNPHNEGKYIQAMTYKAGAVSTVHHIIGTWRADGKSGGEMQSTNTGGYGPGSESKRYPADTGAYIPAGGIYNFQMHYTTTGKAQTDRTKVGIYFTKEPPKNILRQLGVMDFTIEIPAGEGRHHERSYVEFPTDAKLYGVRPHAHYRGYSTRLTLRYPDGAEKILHSQPRYDFSWQREYTFENLIDIPKGSLLIADYIFDNSVENRWNPDHRQNVTFGEQTMDEMLFTYIYYYLDGETRERPRDDVQRAMQASIAFSAMDDNIDGKIQPGELRGPRMNAVRANFAALDKNKDGGLDRSEFPAQPRGVAALADGDLTATIE